MNLEDQYCSINADIVADYLERRGMPRFAQFVRYLGDSAKATNWEADEWKRRFEEMRDRLGKYEPDVLPRPSEPYVPQKHWTGD
jgi:hypothetical protein